MNRDDVYLRHIHEAAKKIGQYVSVGRDEFFAQSHWQDSVIRQLEIIGEATKRLSDDTRNSSPEIPWKRIAGLRDVLIHDYMGVDLEAVWEIANRGIPELMISVEKALRSMGAIE
jgi:uncharacterized protein with HEPN domain